MVHDPMIGSQVMAKIIDVKGVCSAGHCPGDEFPISCYRADGMCGFFYNAIFADLQMFQFGGNMPWWEGDTIEVQCPDSYNLVTARLERKR